MRVKFIYPPRLYNRESPYIRDAHPHIPPLSLPVLVSFLRSHGIKADQDDLDIRNYHLQYKRESPRGVNLTPFLEKEHIVRALQDKTEEAYYRAAERCLRLTKTRGYDVIGFSLVEEFDLTEIGIALLMAKLLKEKYNQVIIFGGSGVENHLHADLLDYAPFVTLFSKNTTHFVVLNLLHMLQNSETDPSKYLLDNVRINLDTINSPQRRLRLPGFLRVPRSESGPVSWGMDIEPSNLTGFMVKEIISVNQHKTLSLLYPEPNNKILPMPTFDGLPLDLYRFSPEDVAEKDKMLILPYYFTLGCQGRCAFCALSDSSRFIQKSAHTIAEELECLSKKYDTRHFIFLNANLNTSKRFTNDFADALIRKDLDLQWADCANFISLDRGLLLKLRNAGAIKLVFGLECPSDRMLRLVGKAITVEKAASLLKISDGLGIWNELEIISGFPHERKEDRMQTERFLRNHHDVVDYFYLRRFYLPNKGRMFRHPERYGIKILAKNEDEVGFAFDEINGLSWKEKKNEMRGSFLYLKSLQDELYPWHYDGGSDTFSKLFYLLQFYESKKEVREHLERNSSLFGEKQDPRGPKRSRR